MKHNETTHVILTERFGKDSLIALATAEDRIPHVRMVDAVYIDGAFYVVTYALSGETQQIAKNPVVALSGEWFTAHRIGENLGHCCWRKIKRSWKLFGPPLRHGTLTVIPTKQTPIPAC